MFKSVEALSDRDARDDVDVLMRKTHLTDAVISEPVSNDKGKRVDLAGWLLMLAGWGVGLLMLLALLAFIAFFLIPTGLSGVIP